jgi:AraC-like DNA-binding protein
MMLKSDVPLSEIAVADQAHLCRVFGRLVGASPSRWRRTHRVG